MRICKVAFLILLLSLIAACSAPVVSDSQPRLTPSSPPPTPSNMDLMCAEAIEEMRRLLRKGGRNITGYDPRGQLASLVETCIQEGRGN